MNKLKKIDFIQAYDSHKINLFKKWGPFLFCLGFLTFSFTSFIHEYGFFSKNSASQIFYIDFFVFFVMFTISMSVLFFCTDFYMQFFASVIGLISAIFMLYTDGNLFTIKNFIFTVWIISIMLNIAWKYNTIIAIFNIIILISVQFHPTWFGSVEKESIILEPNSVDVMTLAFYMAGAIIYTATYRFIIESWKDQIDRAEHLNMVMSQLSIFNQELQNVAKLSGKEAAQEERMRITRDMHDSCGYVFVNIIALMEAAESNHNMTKEQVDEAFSTVRSLAANGLKQTRKTLHAIRDMQNPRETSIDSIYEIKSIFEKVTGIYVKIQNGNIKKDYGHTINSIIIRTMQESLTNAIRHGMAHNIFIAFWDEDNELTMRVEDDGIGSKKIVKGIGLAGMEERLSKVGGMLEVSSLKKGGFKVLIRIPLLRAELEPGEKNG